MELKLLGQACGGPRIPARTAETEGQGLWPRLVIATVQLGVQWGACPSLPEALPQDRCTASLFGLSAGRLKSMMEQKPEVGSFLT